MKFWKLNLKEIRVLKIKFEIKVGKLNLKIGVLKIIWELECCKINLGIGVLEIKF